MMNKRKLLLAISILIVILACNRPIASSSTPDLFATLQALNPTPAASPAGTSVPAPLPADGLSGHIVFTCQLFKSQFRDQICIMNADGSGMRRLTAEDNQRHYYASLAPDGQSVVYSSYREANVYELYSLDLKDGSVEQLTDKLGVLTGPEISPDGQSIVFTRGDANGKYQIMLMDRDGKNVRKVPQAFGWDPTWLPDSQQILFALGPENGVQLYVINRNGKDLRQVTHLPSIRGRSDLSADGKSIVTYAGPSWHREVYILNADGSNAHQLTPSGGNSQGPAFSPDGKWVAFTAYFDKYGDDHGCEIYVIRTDGTDLRRLTNNDYCDYQPRWGP
jgi:Tol biopolymer transport system component